MKKSKKGAPPCADCHYRRPISDGPGALRVCHYLLDTGCKRGLSPQACYRHEGTPYCRRDGRAAGPPEGAFYRG